MSLEKLSKKELMDMCYEKYKCKYSSKNKKQLIEILNSNENHLKPIIKWCGGKGREISIILNYIPKKYKTYIEPFVGGGALFFYLQPENAVINDIHNELICLYNSIKNGKSREIYEFMEKYPNEEETYYKIRDQFKPSNDLEKAQQFFYQRKTCFRGMLRYNKNGNFNIPFGKYKNISYNELLNDKYEKLLKNTEIMNGDFRDIFEKYNDPDNFMFLDPPYDSKFVDYGYCVFDRKKQEELAKCFKTTQIKCMIVIGNTEFIRNLYDGYIIAEYDHKYNFKLYDKRIDEKINNTHLVICNYKI